MTNSVRTDYEIGIKVNSVEFDGVRMQFVVDVISWNCYEKVEKLEKFK